MYRYIFTSSLQRRKSADSYPYNFIFAVQKKVKRGQIAPKTVRSDPKNNTENKPSRYCIQTSKFLLQASSPIVGSQNFVARISIEINMQFIALIPQFQQIKALKLGNVLRALHTDHVKRLDVFKQETGKSPTDLITKSSKDISQEKFLNKQLSVVEESNYKSLTDLLRLREKILVDRTIGLIFWFEVQMERLKMENLLTHISEVRNKQESLLLNMYKERQYINRLLILYEENGPALPIKSHPQSEQSFDDCSSLLPSKERKEPGSLGSHNLCLPLRNRIVHKNSMLVDALFPQRKCKTVDEGSKESESESLKQKASDSQGRAETQFVVEHISSEGTASTINKNLIDSVKPSETLCYEISNPHAQNIEARDKPCDIPKNKGFSIPNLPQKLLYNFNKNDSSIIDRINEDIAFEIIEEHKKVQGQDDSTSNALNSLRLLRCGQNNMLGNSPTSKSFPRDNSDHIEKVILHELYNEDVHWENIYTITGSVLEAVIDELILNHIKHIAKLFTSR